MSFVARYVGRKTGKIVIRPAIRLVEDVASADLHAAATSGAHAAINTESRDVARAAEKAAAKAAAAPEIAIVREANAANRIRAYFTGVAAVTVAAGGVGGGIFSIHRMEQTTRDMGAKGAKMGEDLLKAMHEDMDAALQALKSVPQGLTEGLNVSGPVKTLIQAGSTAVMVGGVIFTVYGTYRLFR